MHASSLWEDIGRGGRFCWGVVCFGEGTVSRFAAAAAAVIVVVVGVVATSVGWSLYFDVIVGGCRCGDVWGAVIVGVEGKVLSTDGNGFESSAFSR